MKGLKGAERVVAVQSYTASLSRLLLAGAGLSLLMVFVQAATGWRSGVEKEEEQNRDVRNGRRAEDEDWEEGLEQGV